MAFTPRPISSLTSFSSAETCRDWLSVITSAATVLPTKFRLEISGAFHTDRNLGPAATTAVASSSESTTHRARMNVLSDGLDRLALGGPLGAPVEHDPTQPRSRCRMPQPIA